MRYDFYEYIDYTVFDIINIENYNILGVNWSELTFPTGYPTFTLSQVEIDKPWLIATNNAVIAERLDIILLVNNISDIDELYVGQIIKVPTMEMIDTFLYKINN